MAVITSVQIKNFRTYKNAEVDFRDNHGVYLFAGNNMAGKSTLLNAINWCLYGDILLHSIKNEGYYDVANDSMDESELTEVRMYVEIEDRTYSFRRSVKKGALQDGALEVQMRGDDGNWSRLDSISAGAAVRSVLPKEIRHLFFFNGEQLQDIYTNNDSKEHNLKNNVYKVSEIDLIDYATSHLSYLRDLYLREIKKHNSNSEKIDKLSEDVKSIEAVIKAKTESLAKNMDKVTEITKKINDLDAILKETVDARHLLERRDDLTAEIKDLDGQIIEEKMNKQDLVREYFHKTILHHDFKEYREALDVAREKSLIPPPIDPKITSEILRTGICICGHTLTDEEKKNIEAQDAEYKQRKELQFLTDGIYAFAQVDQALPPIRFAYQDICEKIYDLTDKRDRKATELKKVNEQLEVMDTANLPDDPELTRTRYEENLQKYNMFIISDKNSLEDNRAELKKAKTELEKAISKDESSAEIEKRRVKTDELIEDLELVKAKMETMIREKLRDQTWKTFSKILPSEYVGIDIDESYKISLVAEGGKIRSVNRASTGQLKALGLSLVNALSTGLGYSEAPLLIDNLYGDISDTHYTELTEMVSNLSAKKQIMIMNLDMEKVDHEFKAEVVKGRYMLEKTKDGTVIEEYGNE